VAAGVIGARRTAAAVLLLLLALVPAAPGGAGAAAEGEGARATPAAADPAERAAPPVSLRIETIGVEAPVETREIEGGALQDPTGPWVVAWYRETARPGESGNAVMGGHVDYWTTGPAVFADLGHLAEGAEIAVATADGGEHIYAVDWLELVPLAELTPEDLRRIVGPTARPSLTLLTCGGAFDPARGEYEARLVVRATRLPGLGG
jgi:sortase (surface protein transpeptidase)